MKFIKFFLVFSSLLFLCSCRGCFRNVSDAILTSGGNPELISYLQGTWILAGDSSSSLQIKRDSIVELHNDTIKNARTLSYMFAGTAEDYFTKDSAFNFLSPTGHTLSTNEFKLLESGQASNDTTTHLLAFVSRSRLVVNTNGKFFEFKKVK